MANKEQLSILKQGVEVWNKWREEYFHIKVDLTEADLRKGGFGGADLHDADLREADLSGCDLHDADLGGANLTEADLSECDLHDADLGGANFYYADLGGANLGGANLSDTDLGHANLSDADLSVAYLIGANLRDADLSEAYLSDTDLDHANLRDTNLTGSEFSRAVVTGTIFANSDLSTVIGLENVNHQGPSSISTDTFVQSKGKIPETFLRGCGLSDWEIELVKLYNPALNNEEINNIQYRMYDLRATQALQISPLFISYSHTDDAFVDKLEKHLNRKGIRFWRDIHDMKSGRMETQVDRAIRQNPTVLLVLSEYSVSSDWVEHEVRTARQLEKDFGRDVLCPVALDDSWKSSRWPKRVMEQITEYNILDFSKWQDDNKFGQMFHKLIDGLELFYKG